MSNPYAQQPTADRREPPERNCLGQEEIMLSVYPVAHAEAKKLCDQCRAFEWCQRETAAAITHPIYGLGVDGTWAGVLYRNGRPSNARHARRTA